MSVASGIVVGGSGRCRGHSRGCWKWSRLLGWEMDGNASKYDYVLVRT